MEKRIKISIIVGTRPEIIKMAPIIKECQKRNLDFYVLHTNQHYSKNLDRIFFKDLGLPQAKYNLNSSSYSSGQKIKKMVLDIKKVLVREKPDIALVEGDTNSVLAGALAASKAKIMVGHIEAGLRSYNKKMPEENNRILTDRCSDLLFAPTKESREILLGEGINPQKIFVTGNTIVDAVYANLKISEKKSKILQKLNLKKKQYFLLTLHRQENVDSKRQIQRIMEALKLVCEEFTLPIIFPMHPRTEKNMAKFKLALPNGINAINPLGYLDFLCLEANAAAILTDSGGIQEEACILKVPCVTLRNNTERPETVKAGCNIIVGRKLWEINQIVQKMMNESKKWKNPFGNGKAAEKIIKIIINQFENG